MKQRNDLEIAGECQEQPGPMLIWREFRRNRGRSEAKPFPCLDIVNDCSEGFVLVGKQTYTEIIFALNHSRSDITP